MLHCSRGYVYICWLVETTLRIQSVVRNIITLKQEHTQLELAMDIGTYLKACGYGRSDTN